MICLDLVVETLKYLLLQTCSIWFYVARMVENGNSHT